MIVLVAYATIEGHTADIAKRIARTIEAEGNDAILLQLGQPGFAVPGRFDAVILAAPVHIGSYPQTLFSFVQNWKSALKDVPCGLVSVSLAIASDEADERETACTYPEQIGEKTGYTPDIVHHAAGALKFAEYDFFKRWMMKRIAAAEGGPLDTSQDHVLTDWQALDEFTTSFLSESARTHGD